MAFLDKRSPQERRKIGLRMCIGSEVLGIAGCIAVIALLPGLLTALYMVGFGLLYTLYNLFLWRTINSRAGDSPAGSSSRQ